MCMKVAIATIADSRADFFKIRKALIEEEVNGLDWIRNEFDCIESEIINNEENLKNFIDLIKFSGAKALIIHIPIWAEPAYASKLCSSIKLPVMLVGNNRSDTSSMVGLLGAGGALDEIGYPHIRIFNNNDIEAKGRVIAFIRAVAVIEELKGQTLGRFGGRSLGIITADIDPSQCMKLFGINVETIDQMEIIEEAEAIASSEIDNAMDWFLGGLGEIRYNAIFTEKSLEKQVRSYLATVKLAEKYKFDLVAVKCQPELSDGYVTQCVTHMLMNGTQDNYGGKASMVHACESDANGALTMHILKLLSGGKATALLDVRWFNKASGIWTLANCGALPLDFYGNKEGLEGIAAVNAVPHIFGTGGGGAMAGIAKSGQVTLARLCRKNGEYIMTIVASFIEEVDEEERAKTTYAFPKAFIKITEIEAFLDNFGSNHIHMIYGDFTEELVMYCRLMKMNYKVWR